MQSGTAEWIKIAIGLVGLLTLAFAASQLATQRRAHLFEVYRNMFVMLDDPAERSARHYVYDIYKVEGLREKVFNDEMWLDPDFEPAEGNAEQKKWVEHKDAAERVCRRFDQLGILVRQGRVPVNLIAQFYTYPIMTCWYVLSPYIRAVRKDRAQPGHMWEFENLVHRIVIPALKKDEGVWKGVFEHDIRNKDLLPKLEKEQSDGPRDGDFNPGIDLWVVGKGRGWWKW